MNGTYQKSLDISLHRDIILSEDLEVDIIKHIKLSKTIQKFLENRNIQQKEYKIRYSHGYYLLYLNNNIRVDIWLSDIKDLKTSYSQEEVIELMQKSIQKTLENPTLFNNTESIVNWINEQL